MRIIVTVSACLILNGCFLPIKPNIKDGTIHINYDKILNSVLCYTINAWKTEHDYHHRPLDTDGTSWFTKIQIIHLRSGGIGAKNSASKTNQIGTNWTQVLGTGVDPSATSLYKLTANTEVYIPQEIFTEDSLTASPKESKKLVLNTEQAKNCSEGYYFNTSELGLVPQFENYIKGFKPEYPGDARLYSDLEFKETGVLKASLGGTYTYSLVPYSALLPPLLSYTDDIAIQVTVNRRDLQPKPVVQPDPKEVIITNPRVHVDGNVFVLNAKEIGREIGCVIKPDSSVCGKELETTKRSDIIPPSQRLTGSNNIDAKRLMNTQNSQRRITGKGLRADPDREFRRRLLEEAVDSLR